MSTTSSSCRSSSKHPVAATANGSVECESCHNAHVVTSTAIVTDPDNTYNKLAYGTTAEQAYFCLQCHNGSAPKARTVNNLTYIPYTVTMLSANMDKSANAAKGHWSAGFNGSTPKPAAAQSCALCHDNHGSDYVKLLGARYPFVGANGENRINNTAIVPADVNGRAITGNDNSVCFACHTSADEDWPSFVRSTSTVQATRAIPSMARGRARRSTTNATTRHPPHRSRERAVARFTSYAARRLQELPRRARYGERSSTSCAGRSRAYDTTRPASRVMTDDASGPSTGNIAPVLLDVNWWNLLQIGRFGHKGTDGGTVPDRTTPVLRLPQPARVGFGLTVCWSCTQIKSRPTRLSLATRRTS